MGKHGILTMERKGMALEMVVMMIILLVVAAVIIAIFLGIVKPPPPAEGMCEVSRQTFMNKCTSLCDSYRNTRSGGAASEFCEMYMGREDRTAQVDWNCDKKPNEVADVDFGKFMLPVCENSVYCFMAVQCPGLDAEGCREALCRSSTEKYKGDRDRAAQEVAGVIQTGEEENFNCNLPGDEFTNWYTRFGFADQKTGRNRYTSGSLCQ